MNSQSMTTLSLAPGEARRVARGAGELTVLSGRVWLTTDGEERDEVLAPGQQRRLDDARSVVVEAWDRGEGAVLRWRPRVSAAHGFGLARGFAGGFGLGAWTAGLLGALARNAASSASRAQGCIKAGDSMASSGALK